MHLLTEIVNAPIYRFAYLINYSKRITMSIEALLSELIAAVKADTAARTGGATETTKPAATVKAATTKATTKVGPTHTAAELNALGMQVKEKFDRETASAIILKVGKAEKLPGVKSENYDALYDALEAKLAEDVGEADDDGI